jgi:hypothetical protein
MDYLDELPTQKEISGIKVSGTKWLSIKRKEKAEQRKAPSHHDWALFSES